MDQLRADALLDLVVGDGIALGEPVGHHTAGLPGPGPKQAAAAVEPAATVEPVACTVPEWDPEWPTEPTAPAEPGDLPDDPAVAAATGPLRLLALGRWPGRRRGVALWICRCRWRPCWGWPSCPGSWAAGDRW